MCIYGLCVCVHVREQHLRACFRDTRRSRSCSCHHDLQGSHHDTNTPLASFPQNDLHSSDRTGTELTYMLARDAAASLPRPTPVRPVRPAPPPELGVAAPGRLSAFSAARQPPIQPGRLAGTTPASEPGLADPPASGRRRPAPASEGLRGGEGAAIEGWLAGLGLERYAELLLRAGWDSVEVTCACHISVGVHC